MRGGERGVLFNTYPLGLASICMGHPPRVPRPARAGNPTQPHHAEPSASSTCCAAHYVASAEHTGVMVALLTNTAQWTTSTADRGRREGATRAPYYAD
eukprot:scaffold135924_cov31-Tisochrysis_lutea.AAC.2